MLVCHLYKVNQLATAFSGLRLPPLVGCSILITSALGTDQHDFSTSPTTDVGPYRVAHRVPKISQYLSAVWLQRRKLHVKIDHYTKLTPANTLVISSTLIPAKGRLDPSPLAVGAVAMPLLAMRQWHCESSLGVKSKRLELLSIRFIIFEN
jgi:hypothetical protein